MRADPICQVQVAGASANYDEKKRAREDPSPRARLKPDLRVRNQAVNELPQPQPPVEFGLLKVKPAPIIVVT
jgi:hypothetical protein